MEREGLGIDISSLAQFVAQVKCTVFSGAELEILAKWSEAVGAVIDIHKPSQPITDPAQLRSCISRSDPDQGGSVAATDVPAPPDFRDYPLHRGRGAVHDAEMS